MYVLEELYSYEKMFKANLELSRFSTHLLQKGSLVRMLRKSSTILNVTIKLRHLNIQFDV